MAAMSMLVPAGGTGSSARGGGSATLGVPADWRGAVTDLVCTLGRDASIDDINAAFHEAAAEPRFDGIIAVTHVPLVSANIIGRPQSCLISACDTMARGTSVKVLGWYDNEWGYANRLLELATLIGR